MVNATEELDFNSILVINTNLKGHMWLVATVLGGSGLEPPPKHVGQSSSFSLGC